MDGIGNFRNIIPKGISKTFDEKKMFNQNTKPKCYFAEIVPLTLMCGDRVISVYLGQYPYVARTSAAMILTMKNR